MIPIGRPSVGEEEARAAYDVIKSGNLASGEQVKLFEQEFSDYIGVSYGIATSNGTTALQTTIQVLGIGQGDEVVVPAFTFIATASSVSLCGASPVVADIEPVSYCINPDSILEQINDRTKAVLAVHLFGHPCDIGAILEICEDHGLFFIEDCAQAHGAKYRGKNVGSFGDAGCFSFYPTKNMTTGEGGFITTSNPDVDRKARLIINHGQKTKYHHVQIGNNFRLTDICAAIGRVQLRKLDLMNGKRQINAQILSHGIQKKGVATPITRNDCVHVFHQYVIRVIEESGIDRDTFIQHLNNQGIDTAVHYPISIHKQPVYSGKIKGSSCPVTQQISQEILSLPVFPDLLHSDLQKIIDVIHSV